MLLHYSKGKKVARPAFGSSRPAKEGISAFLPKDPAGGTTPALIHFSETPLFRLEKCSEKYAHLLKKKDMEYISPIVNYLINNSGQVAFLAGDVVRNLYLCGKRKYKAISILVILTAGDIHKYSGVMNNIISSNDGAFSMGLKYMVRKNRQDSCFKDIAVERYVIEQRLEGPAKLLYLFRAAPIELDLTTQSRFSSTFGVEMA